MGGVGLIFTSVLVRRVLRPPGLSGPMTTVVLGLISTLNSPIGRYNPPLASYPPPPPTPLLPLAHPLIYM